MRQSLLSRNAAPLHWDPLGMHARQSHTGNVHAGLLSMQWTPACTPHARALHTSKVGGAILLKEQLANTCRERCCQHAPPAQMGQTCVDVVA